MAFPTVVNDQITDAVTQFNVKVPAPHRAMAMGTMFSGGARDRYPLFEIAVSAQQQHANRRLETGAGPVGGVIMGRV